MPWFERADTTIYYEEYGHGFPLLLLAGGGMNSGVVGWKKPPPGADGLRPLETLAEDFRLIAMDQRNAGQSKGPLDAGDPWGSYAGDQLALLDHLGVGALNALGCCIGPSYILKLIERAPKRVAAAVFEQPIGIRNNARLYEMHWRTWAGALAAERDDLDSSTIEEFGTRMWGGDFVLSVTKEFVRSCDTPLLVLPGVDEFHPAEIGREVAALAPQGEVFEPWKDTPEHLAQAVQAVRAFLRDHTPEISSVSSG